MYIICRTKIVNITTEMPFAKYAQIWGPGDATSTSLWTSLWYVYRTSTGRFPKNVKVGNS